MHIEFEKLDAQEEPPVEWVDAWQKEVERRMWWLKWTVIFPCFLVLVIALFLFFSPNRARAADVKVCAYITSLPRNCESVQKVVNRYGHRLAFWFARRCGATEQDLKEAETCLRKPGT